MCSQCISDQVRLPVDNRVDRAPTQTYTFSILSLLSKYFIHHIQIEEKVQQRSFIATEIGGKYFSISTKGKNVVLGQFVSPNATVICTPALVDAIPTSHSAPWQRLCRGYEMVIIYSRSLFHSQMSKVRPAHRSVTQHTRHSQTWGA